MDVQKMSQELRLEQIDSASGFIDFSNNKITEAKKNNGVDAVLLSPNSSNSNEYDDSLMNESNHGGGCGENNHAKTNSEEQILIEQHKAFNFYINNIITENMKRNGTDGGYQQFMENYQKTNPELNDRLLAYMSTADPSKECGSKKNGKYLSNNNEVNGIHMPKAVRARPSNSDTPSSSHSSSSSSSLGSSSSSNKYTQQPQPFENDIQLFKTKLPISVQFDDRSSKKQRLHSVHNLASLSTQLTQKSSIETKNSLRHRLTPPASTSSTSVSTTPTSALDVDFMRFSTNPFRLPDLTMTSAPSTGVGSYFSNTMNYPLASSNTTYSTVTQFLPPNMMTTRSQLLDSQLIKPVVQNSRLPTFEPLHRNATLFSKLKAFNVTSFSHTEVNTIKTLINGYKESATFLFKTAHELEQLINDL